MWTDSISDWHWQWNPLENHLAESTEKGWRIWLPQQNNRGNQLRCQPTELYTTLTPGSGGNPQLAGLFLG